jgi:hypothetical protein
LAHSALVLKLCRSKNPTCILLQVMQANDLHRVGQDRAIASGAPAAAVTRASRAI